MSVFLFHHCTAKKRHVQKQVRENNNLSVKSAVLNSDSHSQDSRELVDLEVRNNRTPWPDSCLFLLQNCWPIVVFLQLEHLRLTEVISKPGLRSEFV